MPSVPELESALAAFVTGEVQRVRLDLPDESSREAFGQVAARLGYRPARVAELEPAPGHRIPAFLIRNRSVWFGWLFDEKFTEKRSRRLWASVERDSDAPQHDWRIVLGRGSRETLLANPSAAERFDPSRPDLY